LLNLNGLIAQIQNYGVKNGICSIFNELSLVLLLPATDACSFILFFWYVLLFFLIFHAGAFVHLLLCFLTLLSLQCKREGFVQRLKDEHGEGCNIHGFVDVNKVAGNFHFAPGKGLDHAFNFLQDMLNFQPENYNASRIHFLSIALNQL
jgi:hypothetical protein